MTNSNEIITNVTKYIKKLRFLITNNAKLKLFGKTYISKSRADDIMCCLEANLPKEYTQATVKPSAMIIYSQLIREIRQSSVLISDCYSVRQNNIMSLSNKFLKQLETDLKKMG